MGDVPATDSALRKVFSASDSPSTSFMKGFGWARRETGHNPAPPERIPGVSDMRTSLFSYYEFLQTSAQRSSQVRRLDAESPPDQCGIQHRILRAPGYLRIFRR